MSSAEVERIRTGNDAHVVSVHQTATGWRWGCSCGKAGKGGGTPTAQGAWAAANRHVFAARRPGGKR